jgi:biopolymer transport protein ExbB
MTIVAFVALGIAILVYNFLPDYIKKGGPLVALLIMLSIMSVTLTFERLFTLARARGKQPVPVFMRAVRQKIDAMDIEGAADLCAKQRGSLANVLRAGLDRYAVVRNVNLDLKTRMEEVQKAMEEANMLEVPLLERNLIALATIASIATMVGLLGTVIGMIRSFAALGHTGSVDAVKLALGISEALVNTAGGLFVAIFSIVLYNVFVTMIDNFNYMMDEASVEVVEVLSMGGDEVNAREENASDRGQDRHDTHGGRGVPAPDLLHVDLAVRPAAKDSHHDPRQPFEPQGAGIGRDDHRGRQGEPDPVPDREKSAGVHRHRQSGDRRDRAAPAQSPAPRRHQGGQALGLRDDGRHHGGDAEDQYDHVQSGHGAGDQ